MNRDAHEKTSCQTDATNRLDHQLIAKMIAPETRVLDVGCGEGALLLLLQARHNIDARGVEISPDSVTACLRNGLTVVQGDANKDLINYPDDCFDYVILSQTLQTTLNPREILLEMLRIGRNAIVSFPNFGHWRVRLNLLFSGKMPITPYLDQTWYDTPNIHFCTIRDFLELVASTHAKIEKTAFLTSKGSNLPVNIPLKLMNLFGEQAIFLLKKQ